MKTTHRPFLAVLIAAAVVAILLCAHVSYATPIQDQQLDEAIEYINNSQLGPAWEILNRLSGTMSRNPRFLVTYGRYFMHRGQYARALEQFEKASKYDPTLVHARSAVSSTYSLYGAKQLTLPEVIDLSLIHI